MAARILPFVESPRGLFCYRSVCGANAQPASVRCRMKGVWAQPNKHFEFGFEKSNSKIASWYQLALLAAVANAKIFVQKNNRPLQVELENRRS